MSLQSTEKECADNAVDPRISLADIEAAMIVRYDTTGVRAVEPRDATHMACYTSHPLHPPLLSLKLLSICIVVMKSGFTVIGKSAPDSAANFNAELGRELAYQDAIRQLWTLMGGALKDTPGLRERYGIDKPDDELYCILNPRWWTATG
jgi:Phage protein (N4 Gp49/phage Sf6 gene 66) family